jgi:micrococcal nuclease
MTAPGRTRGRGRWLAFAVVVPALIAVALAALTLSDRAGLGLGAAVPGSSEGTLADGIPPRPADAFAMTVEYVIDGDTIKARMNEPNDVIDHADRISVRLIGIDTPEARPEPECWSAHATDHLSGLLGDGDTVWAAPDEEAYDRYDRALMYLWTDEGEFINYSLVAAGDAEALRVPPNDEHAALFAAAESAARAADAGQWGAC